MARRVAVLTDNDYLWQKIRLALPEDYSAYRVSDAQSGTSADIFILDTESHEDDAQLSSDGVIRIGRGGDIPQPFTYSALLGALCGIDRTAPVITPGAGCVYLRGEKIPLTDVEAALFGALYDARGEYVSRDELIERVWGDGVDGGVLNVYVHYLREKLEAGGERVILASRGEGYKINEKFLGGRR
jgi:hypothetical protein